MDILKIIKSRRSVRRYKNKEIPEKFIKRILEAGRWAPSGLNNQPWRFLIIQGNAKENLAKFLDEEFNIKEIPVLILVLLDLKSSYHREKDLMALGACIQNMCLEAHSLGIGSCWIGRIWNNKEEIKKLFNLKNNLEPAALITLGYSREKPKSERLSLKELIVKNET